MPMEEEEVKSERIVILVTPSEKQKIEEACKRFNLSTGEFTRTGLRFLTGLSGGRAGWEAIKSLLKNLTDYANTEAPR